MRKYHKTVDYLILAAELVNQGKLASASKALVKATAVPGAKRALAELDAQQQKLQDLSSEDSAEESKTARALARALSLTANDVLAEDDGDENPFAKKDEDDDDGDDDDGAETSEEIDLDNVSLEADNTDGQLMRDSADQPVPDTTKAAVIARNLRKALHSRFAKR